MRVQPGAVVGPALVLALGLAVGMTCALAAAKGQITVDKVEYQGWKNNLRVRNGDAELILTLDVGPRILSYRLAEGKNVFKEFPEQMGKSGESEWQSRGGHRLWIAPEDTTRTYALDNSPVAYQELAGGTIRLTPAPSKEYGIQKEIDVQLAPHGSRVSLIHRVTNIGSKPAELAPWAISVMAPGGVEIIPLPPKRPHPGPPQNAKSAKDFGPSMFLTLWPYFDFKDPRWNLGSKYITLRQDSGRGPTKIGLSNAMGWVAYRNQGTLFVKRFGYQEDRAYPDNGCNYETFTNQDMLEMESLAPLVTLAPGQTVEYPEHWDLIGDVAGFQDEAEIDQNILPRIHPGK